MPRVGPMKAEPLNDAMGEGGVRAGAENNETIYLKAWNGPTRWMVGGRASTG